MRCFDIAHYVRFGAMWNGALSIRFPQTFGMLAAAADAIFMLAFAVGSSYYTCSRINATQVQTLTTRATGPVA